MYASVEHSLSHWQNGKDSLIAPNNSLVSQQLIGSSSGLLFNNSNEIEGSIQTWSYISCTFTASFIYILGSSFWFLSFIHSLSLFIRRALSGGDKRRKSEERRRVGEGWGLMLISRQIYLLKLLLFTSSFYARYQWHQSGESLKCMQENI